MFLHIYILYLGSKKLPLYSETVNSRCKSCSEYHSLIVKPPKVMQYSVSVSPLRRFAVYGGKKEGVTVNDLSERQKKFAEYYAQSGNTVQSAIKAGYSENYANANACKLLDNVRVAEYIRELAEKDQDKRIMTAKERRAVLSDIAREGNNQDRIRAIDTLNKMTGEYVTKIEGNLSAEINNPFKELTTEELRKLAD